MIETLNTKQKPGFSADRSGFEAMRESRKVSYRSDQATTNMPPKSNEFSHPRFFDFYKDLQQNDEVRSRYIDDKK